MFKGIENLNSYNSLKKIINKVFPKEKNFDMVVSKICTNAKFGFL